MHIKPVEQTVSFDRIINSNYEEFIVNACASSCKFGYITLQEGDKVELIRGNIHVMLIKPFGTGKTRTIFDIDGIEIEDASTTTMPGLIGTIHEDGTAVIGSVFKAAGKLLRIDEAQDISRRVKQALGSILEKPNRVTRVLGRPLSRPCLEGELPKDNPDTYAYITGSETTFTIMSRFSCICSSTTYQNNTQVDMAWNSRFIPIKTMVDSRYAFKLTRGELGYPINPVNFESGFYFAEYIKFNRYMEEWFNNSRWFEILVTRPDEIGYATRAVGDFVRLGAYMASLRRDSNITFDDCVHVLETYGDIYFYQHLIGAIDYRDFLIVRNCGNKTQEELASLLDLDQATISRRINSLISRGLLKPV